MTARPFARVTWPNHGSEPMTACQRQALYNTERYIRRFYWGFRFIVEQGSWQPETPFSGTSHTGAGVVDLSYAGIGYKTLLQKLKYRFVLRALRKVGRQAAFGRGPWNASLDGTGGMPLHFHTCDLNTEGEASTVATFQVPQYRAGCDGLVAGRRDIFTYRPKPIRAWRYAP